MVPGSGAKRTATLDPREIAASILVLSGARRQPRARRALPATRHLCAAQARSSAAGGLCRTASLSLGCPPLRPISLAALRGAGLGGVVQAPAWRSTTDTICRSRALTMGLEYRGRGAAELCSRRAASEFGCAWGRSGVTRWRKGAIDASMICSTIGSSSGISIDGSLLSDFMTASSSDSSTASTGAPSRKHLLCDGHTIASSVRHGVAPAHTAGAFRARLQRRLAHLGNRLSGVPASVSLRAPRAPSAVGPMLRTSGDGRTASGYKKFSRLRTGIEASVSSALSRATHVPKREILASWRPATTRC